MFRCAKTYIFKRQKGVSDIMSRQIVVIQKNTQHIKRLAQLIVCHRQSKKVLKQTMLTVTFIFLVKTQDFV